VPLESTLPQDAPEQPLPDTFHVTDRFGLPAEFTVAVKTCVAPNSTAIICGEIETEMSLDMAPCAVELFVESSTLVATTETETVVDKFAGAVYVPMLVIVPTSALPPGIPLTLQMTAEFVALFTVAMNACRAPSKTLAVDGATATVIADVWAGGCDGPAPTAPQPSISAMTSKSGLTCNTG
jgi:hypothetical protein